MKQEDTFYSILLKKGWLLSKKNHNTIILFVVINFFAYFALFAGYFSNGFLYRFISFSIAILFSFWATRMIISISNLEQVSISGVFSKLKNIDKFIIASLIYLVFTALGLFLFIIPGLIFCIKYILAPYFAVEGYGIKEAFRLSAEKTSGYKTKIFVTFFFLSIAINLVFFSILYTLSNISTIYLLIGVFVLFVLSLFIIIPWYFGIMSMLYSLLNKKETSAPITVSEIEPQETSNEIMPQPI